MGFKGIPLEKYPDNCAERTSIAMSAAGLPDSYPSGNPWNVHVMGDLARRQLGGSGYLIPQGTTVLPPALNQFNPTPIIPTP